MPEIHAISCIIKGVQNEELPILITERSIRKR